MGRLTKTLKTNYMEMRSAGFKRRIVHLYYLIIYRGV